MLLRNNNITENEYIENLQLQILNNKIFDHLYDIKTYNRSFSKDFYNWQNKQLDINYIFTPYLKKLAKPLEENSKKAYFNKNKDSFKIPKLRNVSYISISPDLFYEEIVLTEEEIKNSYNERLNEFKTLETRNYLQVIFKTKKEADNFYKKVIDNNNFINQAKLFNFNENDIKFDNISKNDLTKNIKDAIFKTSKTGLITPFKTNFGFHVVQINKINKEKIKQINEVSDVIKKELTHNLATEKLYEKIEFINDLAFSGNNLSEIIKLSKIKKLEINKLFNVSRNGDIYINYKPKKSNINNKFFNELWKLEVNEVSELIEINENDFILLNVDSEIEEKQLTYLDAEKIVSEKLKQNLIVKNSKIKSLEVFKNTDLKGLNKIIKLKRIENNNLSKIFNNYVINEIFKTKIGYVNSIETTTGVLTFKILKEHFDFNVNKKNLELIENDFKENMLSDIQSYYYKNFETFHKIKSNLKPLDSLINFNQ